MDDTSKQIDGPLTKSRALPPLPTELWLAIFELVVTYDTHIFNQSLQYRKERTRGLQRLHQVCRFWRDMTEPLVYRHLSFNGDGDLAGDRVTALARLLEDFIDSNAPRASWVRSFWIQGHNDASVSLQEALPTLLFRMPNLNELVCRSRLWGQQIALVAHSLGPQLTKLSIEFDDRPKGSREVLSHLKYFTALTDLHLEVDGHTGDLSTIEPPDMPKLRLLGLVIIKDTNEMLKWVTDWTVPVLSSLVLGDILIIPDIMSALSAFVARHGAGLRMLQLGRNRPTHVLAVFNHTPSLDTLDTWDMQEPMRNLPHSVTQIVFREFPRNIGYGARVLSLLLQTVQLLPPERKLHTIRMASINEQSGTAPFLWREEMKLADTRRVDTWKRFRDIVKDLLGLGVSLLDQHDVALMDVLAEMGALANSDIVEQGDDEYDI